MEVDPLHGSRLRGQTLANHLGAAEFFFGERTVGLEYQLNRFPQVLPRLIERLALGVRARKLFDEGDIPAPGILAKHCCLGDESVIGAPLGSGPRSRSKLRGEPAFPPERSLAQANAN